MLLNFGILTALVLSANMPNKHKNGFTRKFLKPLIKVAETPLDVPLSEISGISNSSVFLAGLNPRAVLILNKQLKFSKTFYISLNVPDKKIVPSKLIIDSPYLYLHLNNLKSVLYGEFPNKKLNLTQLNTEIFTKSIQISKSSLIIRALDSSLAKQVFQKMNLHTGFIEKTSQLIENQKDPGISSDGMLTFTLDSSKIFFIQYLNNEFLCLDTNLNIIYKGKTIDTTSNTAIKSEIILEKDGNGKISASTPRITVNMRCCTSNNYLFILSGLKADNETDLDFNQNSVIDIYKSNNGSYVGSFYVPKVKNSSIKSLKTTNDTLFLLSDESISSYKLPVP
jgi:hypothetical protein